MSTSDQDLRPPRETARLHLPVPGDANAADAPTAIGDLADAIDALVTAGHIGVDAGDIKLSARTAAPTGWLLCDGRLVSRSVFADLFAAIGVAYGAGDGTTTFAIPDYRNVFPVGAASAGATGARGGAAAVALGVAEMPSHAHDVYDPGHAHALADPQHAHYPEYGGAFFASQGSTAWQFSGTAIPISHATPTAPSPTYLGVYGGYAGISLYANGSNGAHENRPPFASVNFFIKT